MGIARVGPVARRVFGSGALMDWPPGTDILRTAEAPRKWRAGMRMSLPEAAVVTVRPGPCLLLTPAPLA